MNHLQHQIPTFYMERQQWVNSLRGVQKNKGEHVECTHYKMTYFPNVPCKWDILFLFSTKL